MIGIGGNAPNTKSTKQKTIGIGLCRFRVKSSDAALSRMSVSIAQLVYLETGASENTELLNVPAVAANGVIQLNGGTDEKVYALVGDGRRNLAKTCPKHLSVGDISSCVCDQKTPADVDGDCTVRLNC